MKSVPRSFESLGSMLLRCMLDYGFERKKNHQASRCLGLIWRSFAHFSLSWLDLTSGEYKDTHVDQSKNEAVSSFHRLAALPCALMPFAKCNLLNDYQTADAVDPALATNKVKKTTKR